MTNDQLLAEVEELLRSVPERETLANYHPDEDTLGWLGRAAAVIDRWRPELSAAAYNAVHSLTSASVQLTDAEDLGRLTMLLHHARADLRMETGRSSVVMQVGQRFEYFEEIRTIIATARAEVFFIDPYLDAEFVPRFLPQVPKNVQIRLLCGPKKIKTLLPSVELFAQQEAVKIAVRCSDKVHDRYLFVDRASCYQSGSSFKDGAKNAAVTLTQITDAFAAMLATYEGLWQSAKVER